MKNLSRRNLIKGATAIGAVTVVGVSIAGNSAEFTEKANEASLQDISTRARTEARKASSALYWVGNGYSGKPYATYSGTRLLDAVDMGKLKEAYEALKNMENILLGMKG